MIEEDSAQLSIGRVSNPGFDVRAGVIEPSESEFAAAPSMVHKRDKSLHYCIDYRALNHPLLLVE